VFSTLAVALAMACRTSSAPAVQRPTLVAHVPYPAGRSGPHAHGRPDHIERRRLRSGSGDGRIVITAAKKYGARGVGIDIDPERIAESRRNAREAGVTGLVEFRRGDILQADVSKATVVTLYLVSSANLKLRPLLTRQLPIGRRVVSHAFGMGDWVPKRSSVSRTRKATTA